MIRTCINKDLNSQCGTFTFRNESIRGCMLTCDTDLCNSSPNNHCGSHLNFTPSFRGFPSMIWLSKYANHFCSLFGRPLPPPPSLLVTFWPTPLPSKSDVIDGQPLGEMVSCPYRIWRYGIGNAVQGQSNEDDLHVHHLHKIVEECCCLQSCNHQVVLSSFRYQNSHLVTFKLPKRMVKLVI